MPLVATRKPLASRDHQLRLLLQQSAIGLFGLVAVSALRVPELREIYARLGEPAGVLITLMVVFAGFLSVFKFHLTDEIFVSPAVIAYLAMIPLLGLVTSAWIAVLISGFARAMAMGGVGPISIPMDDPPLQYAKLASLFGTYGLPMIAAGFTYELLGGAVPLTTTTLADGLRIGAALTVLQIVNIAVMMRYQAALGYTMTTRWKLAGIDSAIYFIGLPYTVLVVFSFVSMGLTGIGLSMFCGVVATAFVRSLAVARAANQNLVQRLSSLSNVAATISLGCSREELLELIYRESTKVLDASLFSIAIFDEDRNELVFELDLHEQERLPVVSIPLGEGLNSWVVANGQHLLIRSAAEERQLELSHYDDGIPTESWLGVPMVVQDRIKGVISVQSYNKNAFDENDQVLLSAIAGQAAAMLESTDLVRDLESLNYDLERRVLERTIDLQELNLKLQAANQAKTSFLANMSHELRTPLNSIIGFSEILDHRAAQALGEKMHGFVENIHASGTHLLALINDILDISKVEAGKLRLSADDFELGQAVESIVEVMRGLATKAEVEIEVEIDRILGTVHLDEGRFKQILLNLLSNAVKFSPPGSVVRVRLDHVPDLRSAIGVESLRLLVADSGPGIGLEDKTKIFEEFYQIKKDGAGKTVGTGLGLPLSKRLVDLHGGTIAVHSTLGEGATFIVELPIDMADIDLLLQTKHSW